MDSRLQQLSLNSSPTALMSASPSRLGSLNNRTVLTPQTMINQTQRSSYNTNMISSNQRGIPHNVQVRSNAPSRLGSNERTYINVNPVAYVSRQGITVNPNPTQMPELTRRSQSAAAKEPQVPAIPRSQLVKKFVEPSYSTILQPERDAITLHSEQNKAKSLSLTKSSIANQSNTNAKTATPPPPLLQQYPSRLSSGIVQNQGLGSSDVDGAIYANTYAFNSNQSVASNYSELEALRSSDSQGSTEEELSNLNQNQLYSGISSTDRLSPVSSSYSELRQATRPRPPQATPVAASTSYQFQSSQNQYDTSLYEPITPGVRARTVSVGANLASPAPNEQLNFNTLNSRNTVIGKSSYGSSTPSRSFNDGLSHDYFGLCSKCFNKIIGEGTGCTAMGRLYHIECFRCTSCECQLQGKPFYALDGKPFCEADYMQTLEKCCKCNLAIMDRILRATGKPYHPQCFTCVMCNKSLDGVPFTVDAKNQIHCIEDFHKRFAPRCSVCHQPIMPKSNNEETVRVVALDRSFHVECYKCEDCGLRLTSEADGKGCYPLDDHVLCKQCNTQRIQLLTQGIE